MKCVEAGDSYGIRTRVTAVKGVAECEYSPEFTLDLDAKLAVCRSSRGRPIISLRS